MPDREIYAGRIVTLRLRDLRAGFAARGEDARRCPRRELEEETGYTADRFDLLISFYPSPGFCTELLYVYAAEGLRECTGQPDEDEELELVRMPLTQAMQLLRRGEITDSKTVVGLLAFG